MIVQLNPPIWVRTPKGDGQAVLIIDYGPNLNSIWKVALFATGEIINVDDGEIRLWGNEMWNIPMPDNFTERQF